LTFRHAAHSGVATHLGDGLHIHGSQQDFTAQVGGSDGGLATRVTRADDDDIVFWKHFLFTVDGPRLTVDGVLNWFFAKKVGKGTLKQNK
jgi:hypothetical protein